MAARSRSRAREQLGHVGQTDDANPLGAREREERREALEDRLRIAFVCRVRAGIGDDLDVVEHRVQHDGRAGSRSLGIGDLVSRDLDQSLPRAAARPQPARLDELPEDRYTRERRRTDRHGHFENAAAAGAGGVRVIGMGATIGQSLPNWGPVAAEGRGRTVAMSNLYTDPDSLKIRRAQAESLLTKESMGPYGDSANPGLLATILHEATHNLGPAHEYKVNGKTDAQAFGGGLSSMMEELKAQTGGLYFIELTRKKGIIPDDLAKQTYVDSIVWAFGHVSRGMYTQTGERKAYSQLAAIQLGFLMDEGALVFDAEAMAANGTDKGAFVIKFDKLVPAVDKLMKVVGGLKAKADKAGADALAKKYVDGPKVPQKQITERVLRFPKPSFVYGIEL